MKQNLNPPQADGAPGGHWNYYQQHPEKHYLYDGDVLLVDFDSTDNIQHLYVNGPTGAVAVYYRNVDTCLYYFLTDQVGSTRAMVNDSGTMLTAVNYSPFGEIQENWTTYIEPMLYTGKEYDDYGQFEYYYYGARYYDPEIGMFSSIDKAAQFPGGYNYCGNNPVLCVDKDGNLFFLSTAFLFSAVCAGTSYYFELDEYGGEFDAYKMIAHALVGGLLGYAGTYGKPNNWLWTTGQGIAAGVVGTAAHNIVDDKPAFRGAAFAGVAGGIFGLVSSEQYKNWSQGYGWRNYEQVCNDLYRTGGLKAASEYYLRINGIRNYGFQTYDECDGNYGVAYINPATDKEEIGICGDAGKLISSDRKTLRFDDFAATLDHEGGHIKLGNLREYHEGRMTYEAMELKTYEYSLERAKYSGWGGGAWERHKARAIRFGSSLSPSATRPALRYEGWPALVIGHTAMTHMIHVY